MYHYAGNNPVRYIDPDGNAVIKKDIFDGQYTVVSQNFIEVALNDKIQSSLFPVFSNKLVDLSYKMEGEIKIHETHNQSNSFEDNLLTGCSILGDLNLSKKMNRIGNIATIISSVKMFSDIYSSYNESNIETLAIESITCSLLSDELKSNSPEITEKLYLFAKKGMSVLYNRGSFSMTYNKLGEWEKFKIDDESDLMVLKNDINNYKRELILGVPNE